MRIIGLASILALSLAVAAASAEERGAREPIVLGQVGLSFDAVVGGIVHELLERQGYAVELVEGPHAEIFPRLGAGEIDVFAAAWLPGGHGPLYAPVEAEAFRLAPINGDARFFWAVPDYVPESAVAAVRDLAKPEVAERMPKRIVSLPEATGLTAAGRWITATDDAAAYAAEAVCDADAPRKLCVAGAEVSQAELQGILERWLGITLERPVAGDVDALAAEIERARAEAPGSEGELFPRWQALQYLHNMVSGAGYMPRLDNDGYPVVRPKSLEQFLQRVSPG